MNDKALGSFIPCLLPGSVNRAILTTDQESLYCLIYLVSMTIRSKLFILPNGDGMTRLYLEGKAHNTDSISLALSLFPPCHLCCSLSLGRGDTCTIPF